MKTIRTIRKLGNSLGITFPAETRACGFKPGDVIEIEITLIRKGSELGPAVPAHSGDPDKVGKE
jgi:bifunctional DNA-binding transcriptional regulator/antitoxin component of YhaV-PrlF toxin-antitoxin module